MVKFYANLDVLRFPSLKPKTLTIHDQNIFLDKMNAIYIWTFYVIFKWFVYDSKVQRNALNQGVLAINN